MKETRWFFRSCGHVFNDWDIQPWFRSNDSFTAQSELDCIWFSLRALINIAQRGWLGTIFKIQTEISLVQRNVKKRKFTGRRFSNCTKLKVENASIIHKHWNGFTRLRPTWLAEPWVIEIKLNGLNGASQLLFKWVVSGATLAHETGASILFTTKPHKSFPPITEMFYVPKCQWEKRFANEPGC